ncbi:MULTISPECIES: MFS transporter [Pontibacillus]|uniref:MFS transporter n=1 Tax=Pontibacillus chungwhensis TaxID=265426 RepID=A0ABY8USZ0_9BACI|nr:MULTISPECIES: MFS transporter [Pontibacillus]MCD5323155.1 MFS transporter [Pontibacillus sp. HN14]WIF96543.1 MFS transporter [Pontibacillus chungwhensis]
MNHVYRKQRKHASIILLAALGISALGDWVYLIALNLMVLDKTGSPLAVTFLYIARPIAVIATNLWAGSIIDRINQRNMMIGLDFIRGLLVLLIPLTNNLTIVYGLVLIIYMASAMSEPTALSYITNLIPSEKRKHFNGWRSLLDSGGFVLGPAIAGALLVVGGYKISIILNGVSFLIAALLIFYLPKPNKERDSLEKPSYEMFKRDWKDVWSFSRNHRFMMLTYFLVGVIMVFVAAIDSLEAAFSTNIIMLSEIKYGLLVSIAGAGYVMGSLVLIAISHFISFRMMIGLGAIFVGAGYVVYSFSSVMGQAATGFFILSFFMAWMQTGFNTFVQHSIPPDRIGRVSSIYGWLEALLTIMATIVIGFTAEFLTLQGSVIVASVILAGLSTILFSLSVLQDKRRRVSLLYH